MSGISILIVDDDLNKISIIIEAIKEYYKDLLSISQASNVQEAFENLQHKEFHLLITDLQMPLKHDDHATNDGGLVLLKNIYRRKNKANVPMYIVGLTQFIDLQQTYQSIWKIWHYDSSLLEWKYNLRDLIFHISLVKSRIANDKIETIFLEGPTDKKVIESSIHLFYPHIGDKVHLETINYGGGASWVERQLFIWAKSLNKKSDNGSYLKAAGIFDDDPAGNTAIEKLRKMIDINSAESNTFTIFKNASKYSLILKSILAKGIKINITLEELIHINYWNVAKANNWLQRRDVTDILVDTNILNIATGDITEDLLVANGFTDKECIVILHKVKDSNKSLLINHVCGLDIHMKEEALISIKYLLKEVLTKLKLLA